MTSGQKIAFSLLTTIILAAGFVITAQSTRLFKILDDRYYSQTQVAQKNDHLDSVAKSLDSYITNVLIQLEEGENAYVKRDSVRSYMDQNPSEALQEERRNLTAQLFNDIPSLSGIRLVDKNGKSLHYSSYDNDVLKINGSYKTYKNYPDVAKDNDEWDYNLIKVNENSPEHRVLLDSAKNRILISVPFNWIGDVYSGSMLFYFNFKDVEQELLKEKIIAYGENIKLVSENFAGGIIINLPNTDQNEFIEPVAQLWKKSLSVKSPEKLLQMNDGRFYLMLSNAECRWAAVAGVYTSDTFQLPQELIWVIYGCVAVTIFLISFLLFSFKRNSETVIKKRLKKIQYGIIKEYLDNKEKIEWNTVVKQLKTRKDDLSGDIYSSLGVHSKKQKKHLDEFLEKSWEEIFQVLEGSKGTGTNAPSSGAAPAQGAVAGITMDQLKAMLEEVLQETSLKVDLSAVKGSKSNVNADALSLRGAAGDVAIQTLDEVEEIEEVEDLDDVEEVEELADDVEDIEEVEDLDDVEEIEEVEELTDDVEDLDDAEEIEEVEELTDDVEEIEEVEELADDAEEVEELEEISDVTSNFCSTPTNPIKFAQALNPVGYEYKESDNTFIRSDLFASTSNVFAEELRLGPEYVISVPEFKPLQFVVSQLPVLMESIVAAAPAGDVTTAAPCEGDVPPQPAKKPRKGLLAAAMSLQGDSDTMLLREAADDVETLPSGQDYTLTQFGSNLDAVQDLESVSQESIVEKEDGLYEIAGDLEYSDVKMDKSFQSLVDSVLK